MTRFIPLRVSERAAERRRRRQQRRLAFAMVSLNGRTYAEVMAFPYWGQAKSAFFDTQVEVDRYRAMKAAFVSRTRALVSDQARAALFEAGAQCLNSISQSIRSVKVSNG